MTEPVNFPHIVNLGEPNGGITPTCPECARLAAELSEARNLLGTLLAILNGDGGQHQKAVGDVQAVADASQRYWKALAGEHALSVYREFYGLQRVIDSRTGWESPEIRAYRQKLRSEIDEMAGEPLPYPDAEK